MTMRTILIIAMLALVLITPVAALPKEYYVWSQQGGGMGTTASSSGNMTGIYVGNTSAWVNVSAVLLNATSWVTQTLPGNQMVGYGTTYSTPFTLGNGSTETGRISYYNTSTAGSYMIVEFDEPITLSGGAKFLTMTYNENSLGGGIRPSYVSQAIAGAMWASAFPSNGAPYNGGWAFTGLTFISRTNPLASFVATNYTIDITPNSVGVNQIFTMTAGTGASNWNNVNAYSLDFDLYDEFEVNGHEPTWMRRSDGHWYQYNEDTSAYDIDWGTSFPEVTTGTITTPGTFTLTASFWEETGGGGTATDTVTVAGAGVLIPITFRTKDYGSGSTVAPSTINMKNIGNGTWQNQTATTGTLQYNVVVGQWYQWTGTATGYIESSAVSDKFTIARDVDIVLMKTITVGAGNNTCWVQVSDDKLTPLSGAAVLLSDGQYKTTGTSGVVTFTVLEGGTYQIDVSKSGYVAQTRTVQVVGTTNAFSFELSKQHATTVPTTAPGEAPTVDTRSDTEKDQEMMDIIRTSGPDLIQLAILVTIITMVGWIGVGKR